MRFKELKEDDYWGDAPGAQERRDQEEVEARNTRLEQWVPEWIDNNIGIPPAGGSFYNDEIYVTTVPAKDRKRIPKEHYASMKQENRELAEAMLDDMRQLDLRIEFELSSLSWYSYRLSVKEDMTEDAADEEEWRMAMGHDSEDPDEWIGGGPEQFTDDNGDVWDSKDAYDDYMYVQKNAKP